MKKPLLIISTAILLFSSCAQEFNQVYKSDNVQYKYEYAKECFAKGKYVRAITLLQELVTLQKGTENAQESLYMLAMAEYNSKDYETAAQYFKKYFQSYPKGKYAEIAQYYVGQSLFMSTPEPRLDQSRTIQAITDFQTFLDLYPDSKFKPQAQQRLFDLQDKLVEKELHSAQLYYDLGTYFGNCNYGGNNYEACIITAQNALKDLRGFGIIPDVVVCRTEKPAPREICEKIARFSGIPDEAVLNLPDIDSVYDVPFNVLKSGVLEILNDFVGDDSEPDMSAWEEFSKKRAQKNARTVKVGLVAKYVGNEDTYICVTEALKAAAAWNDVNLDLRWINAEKVDEKTIAEEYFDTEEQAQAAGYRASKR